MGDAKNWEDFEIVIQDYLRNLDQELTERLAAWPPTFPHIHVHEVIGGLIFRQATLAKEMALSPNIWNRHVGPLILRAMADAHINLTWLMINPEIRCLKYISYGLGQAKLELEHRRAELVGRAPLDGEIEMIEAKERWINEQRMIFLQDVDLGSWSGISVRNMAEEAGCIDFYNYVYTPFSAVAHSMWHHVCVYNLRTCQNPLHRHHRIPHICDTGIDPHYMYLAAKYLQKSLSHFDKKFCINMINPPAFNKLCDFLTRNERTEEADATDCAQEQA